MMNKILAVIMALIIAGLSFIIVKQNKTILEHEEEIKNLKIENYKLTKRKEEAQNAYDKIHGEYLFYSLIMVIGDNNNLYHKYDCDVRDKLYFRIMTVTLRKKKDILLALSVMNKKIRLMRQHQADKAHPQTN